MIELNSKTQQDFLNREWVQRLLDAGVDMSDAKYRIVYSNGRDFITTKDWTDKWVLHECCPTYTVSELLYKLHEWVYPTIGGKKFSGGLKFYKDAPFYIFYYNLHHREKLYTTEGEKRVKSYSNDNYIHAEFEYPIESLASLLIQCHKKDIGIDRKDTGNISDK